MKTVHNNTPKPLRIRLPGGKTLFLGGLKQAKVRDEALEHPPVKALLDAGTIEAVDGANGGPTGRTNLSSSRFGGGESHGGRKKTQSGDR